jgi:hydroxymethylpyrimidine kinase/phosphomethylpyrimidine kinase
MVSTSGSQLLPKEAVATLIEKLLPLTTILTPNIPEGKLLLKTAGVQFEEPGGAEDIIKLAKAIHRLGPQYVLLKGGHLPLNRNRAVSQNDAERHIVLNVLFGDGQAHLIETPYQDSKNTHGTGCSLACE